MDIQKEREAFEEHITDAGLVEFAGYGFEVDECDEYLHEPTQVAWDSWLIGLRRSKTQDIPEGFVLVPKNELTTTYYWDGAEYVVNCVSEYEIDLGKGEIAELEKWEQTKSTKAFFANIYSDEDNFEIVEFDSIEAAELAVRENKAMIEAQEQK